LKFHGIFAKDFSGVPMPKGIWMHAIMGVHDTTAFGVITLKDGTQYYGSHEVGSDFKLRKDTKFVGSSDAMDFTVRNM
jgi:hypothetical protein